MNVRRLRKRSKPAAYVICEAEPEPTPQESVQIKAFGGRARQAARAQNRILMCAVVFVFVFAALGVRLAYISFGQIKPAVTIATLQPIDAPRPEIVDRQGALLATDLPMVALEVAGREVWDPSETAQGLAGILPEIDVVELETKLRDGRYVEVQSDLTPLERREIFSLGLPGVRFATRVKRFYPQADLAAHVIGHGEPGKGGVMGLEKVANGWRDSGPMRSSIDIRVQQVLEDELIAGITEFGATAAWGAVMDVETGEVIALASLPDFDPNAPGISPADFRRNRATYDLYELGSAFKSFTAAAALEENIASEASTYDARGNFRVADRTITDFHGENRILTLSEVIQHSSNIGIARVAGDLGPAKQQDYLQRLGLFESLEIELPENRAPGLPYQWGPVEAATISYGHGISVTPLHLLSAFSAVVNGGVYYQPTFLVDNEKSGSKVFSTETSTVMRRILRRVLTDGTAQYAQTSGYFPIGKTATADKPSLGGYDTNSRIASFVGAVPGYAPRFAILISYDDPQPTRDSFGYATAGWNAAPTFSRVVSRAATVLGLVPVNEVVALDAFVTGEVERFQEANLDASGLDRLP